MSSVNQESDGARATSEEHVFRARYRTRGYEMDGSGFLRPGVLLDLMEEGRARIPETSAIKQALHRGFARAHRMIVDEPVTMGVELELALWISRVGKTSYDVTHVLSRPEGERVAVDVATLVCVSEERRPMPVPEGVRARFRGAPVEAATRIPMSSVAIPEGAYARDFVARPSDENRGRHVSHARFADFLEDTRRLAALAAAPAGDPEEGYRLSRRMGVSYEGESRAGMSLRALAWPDVDEVGVHHAAVLRASDGVVLTRGWMDVGV